ncbi:hypothetical protein V499_04184 [Pseudogymnoascus sp. VKM F-103]|uniref:GmrSD restriction endonucleases N-terminal domain-containing protein n=1 Tax=Pseudogymnoascus verrucosus TaxID=342668 RepID=A0A1B8GP29_9PEZI|nr:uncharacterized protein VE01_04583 [Pseudogymnoascus verrucosus]KFY75940.1 hypothetical protein V499_04184 [Pseudogymnoascus sp. VKM F-103]OBT97603.1 hypothetical protein VE01_04583 [Pseudogymnoascus verrucosus]
MPPQRPLSSSNPSSSLMVSQDDYVPPVKYDPSVRVKAERVESPTAVGDNDDDDFEDVDDEAEGLLADADGVPMYSDADFKIRQVASPFIVQRTLVSLYNLSKTKYLKLDPEYQRDVVWDETRSSGLIASVLQGYFIPPIIFNVLEEWETSDNGEEVMRHCRICVDGKQRLTSLQKFMEGKIGVSDSSHPPKKWYFCHPKVGGVEKQSNHNILPLNTKKFFESRMFCCYEYQKLTPSVEETMFQLVQRGMPLTPAEKMRAMSTPWANFAKQYESDYPAVLSLGRQSRASGFRQIMSIFCQIMEVMSPSGDKKKNREGAGWKPTYQATPSNLTKLLMDTPSLNESVKRKFKRVFDKYAELIASCSEPDKGSPTGLAIKKDSCFAPAPEGLRNRGVTHVKTFSPLEVVATSILLLRHMDDRTNQMLQGDIMEMRVYLRQKNKDLRLNNTCWADSYQFIDVDLIQLRGGAGASRRRAAAPVPQENLPIEIDSDTPDNQAGRRTSARRNTDASSALPMRGVDQNDGVRSTRSGRVGMSSLTASIANGSPIMTNGGVFSPEPGWEAPMAPMAPMIQTIKPRKRLHESDGNAAPSMRRVRPRD